MAELIDLKELEERVILIAVNVGDERETSASLDELEELAQTAGAVPIARIVQNREAVHPGTYLGKGKILEVRELLADTGATGVICDDELSPAQLRNLEDALDTKVMDRTMVILDIFASRARTREGKIQVELALDAIAANPDISVALLDVMVPDIDGFEVCRKIRASGSKMGIIMLTALGQEMDKVTGLMNGADDYVTKPFSPAELIARVDALCRRMGASEEPEEPELESGPFLLNPRNRTLDKNGERVKLTQTEFSIMKLFMSNPGKALSREDILENVWGTDYKGELKIVDVNIRRLRIKIEDNPTAPEYITTIWGYGYKWGS